MSEFKTIPEPAKVTVDLSRRTTEGFYSRLNRKGIPINTTPLGNGKFEVIAKEHQTTREQLIQLITSSGYVVCDVEGEKK